MRLGDEKVSDRKQAKIDKVYSRSRIPKGVLITKDGKPTRPGKGDKKK